MRWIPTPINLVKCNTDGVSRGNPRPSSAAFCIRDFSSTLVVAKGFKIQDTSNLVAEARAIREGLYFFVRSIFHHTSLLKQILWPSYRFGREVGCPLEHVVGGQLHKLFEEIIISESTTYLSRSKYSC